MHPGGDCEERRKCVVMPNWLIRLLSWLLPLVSVPLRKDLETFAKKFREDALKTENQADDILAEIICWLLGIP